MARRKSYTLCEKRQSELIAENKCEALLNEALKLATDTKNNVEWILDWAGRQEELSEYGYTVELHEEIESLKERLEAYPAELPKIENMVDEAKYEFFMANFSKIPLEALEWIVSTVDKNKLAV